MNIPLAPRLSATAEIAALSGDALVWGVLMFASGLAGLHQAHRQYKQYRMIRSLRLNSPTARDGDLARIRGRVRVEEPLTSPLTKTASAYYRVEVELEKSGVALDTEPGPTPSFWRSLCAQASAAPFVIDGGSVCVKVLAEGIALELTPALEREVDARSTLPDDLILLEYVQRVAPGPAPNPLARALLGRLLDREQLASATVQSRLRAAEDRRASRLRRDARKSRYRLRELCILPDRDYELVGSLRHDPQFGWVLVRDPSTGLFVIGDARTTDLLHRQLGRIRSYAGWGIGLCIFGLLILLLGRTA